MFGWFKSEQRLGRQKVKLDRKHLEARTRRFLKNYLDANETRKLQFYRAVEDASMHCRQRPSDLQALSETEDAGIAEATSVAALKVVLEREKRASQIPNRVADMVTDAYATVAIAYHRAAGLYAADKDMQKLGTAAVHMLTMASSYMRKQENS